MRLNRVPDLSFNLPSLDRQTIIFHVVWGVYNVYGIMQPSQSSAPHVQVSIASRLLSFFGAIELELAQKNLEGNGYLQVERKFIHLI